MMSSKKLINIAGWTVFGIAAIVYFFSAERSGSLWDCGEFILGAYKMQVVHPPGAPVFILIGRLFTMFAELLSSNPRDIAFAVNLLSGISTAAAAMFVCWSTAILVKLSLVGREGELSDQESIVTAGAGLVAGLTTAFCTSIWFSAVEGEVYAMSTFFTALTLWAVMKWYGLPDKLESDRWLIFAIYAAALSTGVHLLSILTFPALALFYYFKKYKKTSYVGMMLAALAGVGFIGFIQVVVILGIPKLWAALELMMVNSFGAGFHSGIYPLVLIIAGVIGGALYYSHKKNSPLMQNLTVAAALIIISFSTIGIVVIRANADTPVNMNRPSDPLRLIPYLNREQYGERPILKGPNFDVEPINSETKPRYGAVGDKYEIVDQKISYVYRKGDETLFPRMSHTDQGRPTLYKMWMGLKTDAPLPAGRPSMGDNIGFFFKYQIGWMYIRYFMWNFVGKQNATQGYYSWDPKDGNWLSGLSFIDGARLYNQSELPDTIKNNRARNTYYFLPLLFGIIGLLFHFRKRPNDAIGLLALFVITGLGIIVYSNEPPNEPRERDYVLVGSFFTFCMWIGFGVVGVYRLLKERAKLKGNFVAPAALGLVMLAPIIMGFQNFDDHSRKNLHGASDYANNFLQSCEPNAIIFTYGDNDTYPLWYAQEVEGVRKDIRVVNLSLIAVDWYINQLRRRMNDSPAIKLTLTADDIRGFKRNQVFLNPQSRDQLMDVRDFIKYVADDHPLPLQGGRTTESSLPSTNLFIRVDSNRIVNSDFDILDSVTMEKMLPFSVKPNLVRSSLLKGDLAILDIIASNIWDRPIYFAVTCRGKSLMGLDKYLQLEGLGLKLVPYATPEDANYGLVGKGAVNADKIYDNVMNKFKWGNFDKVEQFVDHSFGPSIQSHMMMFLRTSQHLLRQGKVKKGIDMIDKYFEAFPHMNFKYNYLSTYPFLTMYADAEQWDKLKTHATILAEETAQNLKFYYSLDVEDREGSFQRDFQIAQATMSALPNLVKDMPDEEFKKYLTDLFSPYQLSQLQK